MLTCYLSSTKNPLPVYGVPADPESKDPAWIKMGVRQVDLNDAKPGLTDGQVAEIKKAGRHAIRDCNELPWPKAKNELI